MKFSILHWVSLKHVSGITNLTAIRQRVANSKGWTPVSAHFSSMPHVCVALSMDSILLSVPRLAVIMA